LDIPGVKKSPSYENLDFVVTEPMRKICELLELKGPMRHKDLKTELVDNHKKGCPSNQDKLNKSAFDKALTECVQRNLVIKTRATTSSFSNIIYKLATKVFVDKQKYFLDMMKEYPIVAIAPFCPIISGAHVVMKKESALVLPLNAYACIGLKESGGSGANIKMEIDQDTSQKSTVLSYTDIERVKNDTIKNICTALRINPAKLPNYEAKLAIDIDLSVGCGSSGAVAVANTFAWLATPTIRKFAAKNGKELIFEDGKFSKYSESYSTAKNIAFNLEQYIHGRSFLSKSCEPYSSGASIIGAFEADRGQIIEYNLEKWTPPSEETDLYTFEGKCSGICEESPFPIILVLGQPKHTSECLRNNAHIKEILCGGIDPSFNKFWGWTSREILDSIRKGKTIDPILKAKALAKTALLFKFQNGLYSVLGLDNEVFTRLIKEISSNRQQQIAGGSIIGGGMDGTCIIIAENMDLIKQRIMTKYPSLQILDEHMLAPSMSARILKNDYEKK
jgi:mevalonate kinase